MIRCFEIVSAAADFSAMIQYFRVAAEIEDAGDEMMLNVLMMVTVMWHNIVMGVSTNIT